MEPWVQHYSELYSRENVVTEGALNATSCLPVLEELDSDPTLEELNKALDTLAFLSVIGRLFARVALKRLLVLAERV